MRTLKISGLANKKAITCSVQPLGDPRMSDPVVSDNLPAIEQLSAVSPNGEWLAFDRENLMGIREIITITQPRAGAQEVVVPLDMDWGHSRIRDISNDGTLLFQAELDRFGFNYSHSRRPILFKAGDKQPLVLPPPYDKENQLSSRLPKDDDRPTSHTPYCYTPEGKIFGLSPRKYSEREERGGYNAVHFLYTQDKPGVWTIEYLPDFMDDSRWLWPAYHSQIIWADRHPRDGIIHFDLFDGTNCSNLNLTVKGDDPKVVAVASDNTFICQYSVKGKRQQNGKEFDSWSYTLLAKPQENALQLFKDSEENPWLEHLSANGQYVIGSLPGVERFILKAQGDAYHYRTLNTPGWRIDSLAAVMDDGRVYATGTCIERQDDCFRLKLPLLLTPQW